MDSITQAALGGAIGHVVSGRQGGRVGVIAGMVAGTIPDLDILAYPFIDSVAELSVHRGFSHSFLFAVLAAPVFGYVLSTIDSEGRISRLRWTVLGCLAFLTHVLLDALTVYGTGLLEPFSNYRVALNTIFIVDPLYTVPLLAGLIGAAVIGLSNRRALVWVWIGLGMSTAYLGWTFLAKQMADRAFEEQFRSIEVDTIRFISVPTPMNTVLWRSLAEVEGGFYESFYSIVADERPSEVRFIPGNDSLLRPIESTRALEAARWFSKGFYTVTESGGSPLFHDLRFGQAGLGEGPFALTLAFVKRDDPTDLQIEQMWTREGDFSAVFSELWEAMFHGVSSNQPNP